MSQAPKNPYPKIILNYNNVPLKNLISVDAVFKNYDKEGV